MVQWDEFVNSHEEGMPFHLSCWLKTIRDAYSYKPLLYVLKDESAGISGIVPVFLLKNIIKGTRLVCIPISDYCYPLFKSKGSLSQLFSHILLEKSEKIRYMEIRGLIPASADFSSHVSYKRHFIKLSLDFEEVKKT